MMNHHTQSLELTFTSPLDTICRRMAVVATGIAYFRVALELLATSQRYIVFGDPPTFLRELKE